MNNSPAPEDVRKLLERFDISYEIAPESAVGRDHAIRQVGYVVNLYGDDACDRPLHPGDARSREIVHGLRRIARWAGPADERECQVEIDGFGAALHYPRSVGRGCVRVEIHILHAGVPHRPMDADQKRALEELVGRLEALGVRSCSGAPAAASAGAGRA